MNKKVSFEIEDYDGNTLMAFEIGLTKDGEIKILQTSNCSHADTDEDYIFQTDNELIRIQSDVESL